MAWGTGTEAVRCFDIVRDALVAQGAELGQVVRTRMFVTDIERWEEFGRAHQEVFGEHPPTTTMVEVSRLIDPDMLIEIEADAIVTDWGAPAGALRGGADRLRALLPLDGCGRLGRHIVAHPVHALDLITDPG